MINRPFVHESDQDMTLSDLEAFTRSARAAGGTDADLLRVRASFKGGIRRLALKITMEHNREAAHRMDHADARLVRGDVKDTGR